MFSVDGEESDEEEEAGAVGGLFTVAKKAAKRIQANKITANALDCSKLVIEQLQDQDINEVSTAL